MGSRKSSCAVVWPTDEDEKYPDIIELMVKQEKMLGHH